MVQFILAFEAVCDDDIFYAIIAHIYLQPNIQQNSWKFVRLEPYSYVAYFHGVTFIEVDGLKIGT
jgi:hypothetical protein